MTTTSEPRKEHRREEPAPPEQELPLPDLELRDESADEITGGTRSACEEWGCGSNHNEVLALTA
jgi:hypothetical protein